MDIKEKRKRNYEAAKKYRATEKYKKTHEKYYKKNKERIKKVIEEWNKKNPEYQSKYRKGYYENNKEIINAKNKKRRDENIEFYKKIEKESRLKLKKTVLDAYGNKCECCGETRYEFLTLNHINNNGAEQRKTIGNSGKFYRYLIRNNYPDYIRVLCRNCNCSRGLFGYCPHEKEKGEKL